MNVTVKLFNSLGCKLDERTVTVNDDDGGGITFRKLADTFDDWVLEEGDTLKICDVT